MGEALLSVGIDIGTTTTQVVISRLEIENKAAIFAVPRIRIVDKKIVYSGAIHFTPLLNQSVIDIQKLRIIIEEEYRKAGVTPKEVNAGAAIITGEAARKENSEAVISTLSGLAGDFVVATAGSDFEAVLAGRGAGIDDISSRLQGKALVNLDIGGGTSNIAVFKDGATVDTSCLDIGGRQIVIDPRTEVVTHISEKMSALAKRMGLKLVEGQRATLCDIESICARLAEILAQSLGLAPLTADLDLFITVHPLRSQWQFAGITYSGGVADFIYNSYDPKIPYPFGDIGPVLGNQIRLSPSLNVIQRFCPRETIRATVVGAGANAIDLSGSTSAWNDLSILPIQNIPIVKLSPEDEADSWKAFAPRLAEKLTWFKDDESGAYQTLALGFAGVHNPSFDLIKDLSGKIVQGLADYLKGNNPVILI
ncbi:MAG: ethanolamine ammonia-lyase reactivating factor EutA, partial [Treponema sp.]|nr:ethanolamine ammonia-lyase reactivating factor EutA [Treponema sp.]